MACRSIDRLQGMEHPWRIGKIQTFQAPGSEIIANDRFSGHACSGSRVCLAPRSARRHDLGSPSQLKIVAIGKATRRSVSTRAA